MPLEPKSLDIPLYKRDWSNLWFVMASAGAAWLFRRPTNGLDIAITCLVGGLAIWLTLGPGLNAIKYHANPLVRLVTFVGSIVGCLFVLQTAVPWLLTKIGA